MLKLTKPENGSLVPVQTEIQKSFRKMDRRGIQMGAFDWLDLKRNDTDERTYPQEITVEWEPAVPGLLQVSETEDFANSFTAMGDGTAAVCNLKCGTKYFVRVLSGDERSDTVCVQTEEDAPRFLRVDGISNVRDCGGWKTLNGKRVKQGLLFRGSELNSHVEITPLGIQTMLDEMKIKTDLDLRGSSEERKDVLRGNYRNISCGAYAAFLERPEVCREIFTFLCDEEAYPIYYHCWGGADRTGTVAFLLGAILGVSEEDLMEDYELTSLSIWGVRTRNSENFREFRGKLEEYAGETIHEKVENYLLSCGVTVEQMNFLRGWLLEE